ncbi:hypothetical protein [Paractinoplanes toevensis]|uniref:Uncharacterized protein n=1 Tax=Paractinoplanes toevensis TaxID=571911 RepID=A0A919W2N5_9ACTN|nr:hypothetical protein [Actinoplanes toevensis]GIM93812.1 hypothetical protein Ato02nite_056050 [Actinoplanes toevensis]
MSQAFRMLVIPLVTAGMGMFIRYITANMRREPLNESVFIVWPELLIAALFNTLIKASDIAQSSGPRVADDLLNLMTLTLVIALALWGMSFVAGKERDAGFRRIAFTYTVPHLVAVGALEVSLLLAASVGGA